jgi:hypothetical protein
MTDRRYCTRDADLIAGDARGATTKQIAIPPGYFHELAAT